MEQTKNIYESADYKRSRIAYMAQCAFEYFVAILVGDAFLAKLLAEMGISDAAIGVISSFISAAFLFQLAALFLVQKIKNVKRTATFFNTFGSLLFMCLYLLPFLPLGTNGKTAVVTVVILTAYFSNYLVTSVIYKWGNSYVNPAKRGTYSAAKEMISLVSGIAVTLIAGYVFDRFEKNGDIKGGFIFMAATIFVITLMNFISLLLIKDNEDLEHHKTVPFKEVLDNTLRNKNFVNVVIMSAAVGIAQYMTIGFLGVYKTKDLMISVGAVQVINMAANLARFSVSLPFGKFANRYGFAKGLEVGYIVIAAAFLANIFCTPKTWWCIVVYTVLYNVGFASVGQNSMNIVYSYVKSDYFVQASAIKGCITGISGFAASLVGSRILSAVQAGGNSVFGIHMYGQQLLSVISFVILTGVIAFVHFVVSKQKAMIQ